MKVEFRNQTPTDASRVSSRIHDYWISTYSNEVEGGVARLEIIFNNEENTFHILRHMTEGQVYADVTLDGESVGLVSYRVNGSEFYIDKLYVDDGYRGIGIGTVCMEHMLDLARSKGCSYVALCASPGNVSAHRFYARFGFIVERSVQITDGRNAIGSRDRMVKNLTV